MEFCQRTNYRIDGGRVFNIHVIHLSICHSISKIPQYLLKNVLVVLDKCLINTKCNKYINPETNLKWLNVKLDYVGKASRRALGHHQFGVKIYSDVIKALLLQWIITPSFVHFVLKELLDPLTEWPHKVLSQQPEVRVEVEVGVCVALRGEVGSQEGPVFLMELLTSWVDGYGPEILLIFFTWVRNNGSCSY